MRERYDVIVVGAGASGLLCAGQAAKNGLSVLLLEKMERPARKVMITGKGRCNVTNNCEPEDFMRAVRSNSRFLYSALHALTPKETMAMFEELGVPLKTERGDRVFPVSDRAVDVVDALAFFAKQNGVELRQNTAVQDLIIEDGKVCGVTLQEGEACLASRVVIATGGKSYPLTGSTGDGYRLAEQAGHTVTPLSPSLTSIITQEDWCKELMGLSLKNVRLKLWKEGKKKPVYDEIGEMLFTHFGVSGPLILSATSHMSMPLSDYRITIDLKPGLEDARLDDRLLRDFEKYTNRDFHHSLDDLLPRKMIPVFVRLSGIPSEQKIHQITKEQRAQLLLLFKQFTIHPKAFRPIEEAVVTSGGVNVKEVSPSSMESRLVSGLYFVGEVLDVDAYTGGYNLQIAFSTGYLAAQSMAKEEQA